MRPFNALFMLVGVLLASAGYGATFLFSMRVRLLGGTDFQTGVTLAGAALGTLIGVPLTGWAVRHIGAARMAALAALTWFVAACGLLALGLSVLRDRRFGVMA